MERVNVVMAVFIAVVFGLLHASNYAEPDVWAYVSTLSQICGGLGFWYLLEKEGVLAPIMAHFYFNMIVWFIVTKF